MPKSLTLSRTSSLLPLFESTPVKTIVKTSKERDMVERYLKKQSFDKEKNKFTKSIKSGG